ncbi:MAG: hypothetical protein VX642_11150 [Bdellovibrionota bacterium]|nr:hypothetical protein [Bdellovibrionota bacterium]
MKKLILALMVSMFSLAASAGSMPCDLKMGSNSILSTSSIDSDSQTR